MLSEKEITRYSRHLLLPEIGIEGQEKIKNSKVLIIGAGGLGCSVLMYLTAAGVGKIGIIDFDTVDETNLQRQVLYDINDVGQLKSEIAKYKLSKQNPLIEIESINSKLSTQNAIEIFSEYTIIVDGTDNFSTRYMVNDACVLSGKTLVSGSIFKFQGQVSVFNYQNSKKEFGPTYRCLFASPPPAESAPSCSEIGVMGVLPGIIGTLMANEVIKIIASIGKTLSGKILLVDSLTMNFHTIAIERNPEAIKSAPQSAEAFRKTDYDYFCGIKNNKPPIREISSEKLFSLIASEEKIQLLDVREPNEMPEVSELNDLKVPLGEIEKHIHKIYRDKKVIVICRSGNRSRKAIELLYEKFGFQNLYNLKGGVMEWIKIFGEKQKHERQEKA
ncbi:MAG: molybdopterin-synthase adenylyltransferase MoeB [Bacteroidetes bacterium]|nr:molybdopterin-synthase adenylyltransferase MoeB [Bacteroidota bacterium]